MIHRINHFPIQVLARFLGRIDKQILKCIRNFKDLEEPNKYQKNNIGEILLPDLKF